MTSKMKSLITLSVVFVAGLLLSIGTHMVFNPIKEERAKAETLTVLNNYFPGVTDFEANTLETLEGVELLRSVRVFKGEDAQGYLYEANINNEYGNMKVRFSVDVTDIIQVIEFIEMNQTMYQAQTEKMLTDYHLKKLSSDIFDGAAGATSISKKDLSHLVSMVGLHHDNTDKFEFVEPYNEYFGTGYVISSTENITENKATIKVEVIENKGTVYTITKSGIYQTDNIEEKSITMIVVLDNDNKILGVLLPVDLYHHTTRGNFMTNALEFAESFIGDNLADLTDGNVGATDPAISFNSRSLIEDMLLIVQKVHIGPYAVYFGNGYEVENTDEITQDNAKIVVETIKDKGAVYTITKSSIYKTGDATEKDITLIIILDANDKMIGVLLPEDRYNHSKRTFYQNALAFASSYTDTNLADVTDGNAGVSEPGVSFNSRSLIEDMILIIQGVHLS